jgi:hypothetical protein
LESGTIPSKIEKYLKAVNLDPVDDDGPDSELDAK